MYEKVGKKLWKIVKIQNILIENQINYHHYIYSNNKNKMFITRKCIKNWKKTP